MSSFAQARLIALLVASISFFISTAFVHAQSSVNVIGISPAANDVSEQTPAAPARISLFAWQAQIGTVYTISFSIAKEPSLVVGIGAEVLTTSFDEINSLLTVVASYSGEKILGDENIILPDNAFLIALDPGVQSASLPSKFNSGQDCYGPGADPSLYNDSSGDFGDDDGLNDPPIPSDAITTVGLPQEAAGTFASTNAFYWCITPPQGETQATGMRLLAKKNSSGRLNMTFSSGLVQFMATRLSRVLSTANLAIFSEDLQVSVDVDDTTDGSSIAITLPIDSNSTKIVTASASSQAKSLRKTIKVDKIKTAKATSESELEQRTIKLGAKEALTISPDSLKIVGQNVILSGFVDDLTLVGEIVEIVRIGINQKCGTSVRADSTTTKGTVIARGKIQSDGSYNVKIPTSAVFNGNNKKSKLVARIPGDSVKTSREISLSNRNRDLRQ